MGIFISGKGITEIIAKGRVISAIYAGVKLVWQSVVIGCFGAGWWIDMNPWDNKDGWKN